MKIERDRVTWTAGLRFGKTLGSPLAFSIPNRDWANWQERMSIEPRPASERPKPITLARPGHADLAGAVKYDTGETVHLPTAPLVGQSMSLFSSESESSPSSENSSVIRSLVWEEVGDQEIATLEQSGVPRDSVVLRAPFGGAVVERMLGAVLD